MSRERQGKRAGPANEEHGAGKKVSEGAWEVADEAERAAVDGGQKREAADAGEARQERARRQREKAWNGGQ